MCTNVYSITKNTAHTAQWASTASIMLPACVCIYVHQTGRNKKFDGLWRLPHIYTSSNTHTHAQLTAHTIHKHSNFDSLYGYMDVYTTYKAGVCVLVYKYHRQTSNWTLYTKSIFNSIVWIGFFCLLFVFLLSTYKRRRLSRRYLLKPPLGFGHQNQHSVWCDGTCNRNFPVLALVCIVVAMCECWNWAPLNDTFSASEEPTLAEKGTKTKIRKISFVFK